MKEIELLKKCAGIVLEYEQKQREEGTQFNIFSILKVESREVRLHSKFIAELLDNKGSHTLGNLFFKLFLKELKTNSDFKNVSFNEEKYKVEVEKTIGFINDNRTEGGRIDIYIEDNQNNAIIIENKIYASDQEHQLLRYQNYLKAKSKSEVIIYLTLTGYESSESVKHYPISYSNTIVNWLTNCIQEVNNIGTISYLKKSKIESTLKQYIDIVKNYLVTSNQNEMSENIKKEFQNIDNLNAVKQIITAYNELLTVSYNDYINDLTELSKQTIFQIKYNNQHADLKIGLDGGEFWYGYELDKLNSAETKKLNNLIITSSSQFKFNKGTIYTNGTNETYINHTFKDIIESNLDFQIDVVLQLIDEQKRKEFIQNTLIKELKDFKKQIEKILEQLYLV